MKFQQHVICTEFRHHVPTQNVQKKPIASEFKHGTAVHFVDIGDHLKRWRLLQLLQLLYCRQFCGRLVIWHWFWVQFLCGINTRHGWPASHRHVTGQKVSKKETRNISLNHNFVWYLGITHHQTAVDSGTCLESIIHRTLPLYNISWWRNSWPWFQWHILHALCPRLFCFVSYINHS